jgi:hypothetical protein
MHKSKLGTSIVAALITLAGAAHLAQPAEASAAAAAMKVCSDYQAGYAQGWVDSQCGGSGTVHSCSANADGSIDISYSC